MLKAETRHDNGREIYLQIDHVNGYQGSTVTLERSDILSAYHVAEFTTLARDGSPVCWPLAPDFEGGRLIFSTGYIYPTKARNAQRKPRGLPFFLIRPPADVWIMIRWCWCRGLLKLRA